MPDKPVKLALKTELFLQLEQVTDRLLNEPELKTRLQLVERRDGLQRLIQICKDRNKF